MAWTNKINCQTDDVVLIQYYLCFINCRRITGGSKSLIVPNCTEQALITWVNEVCRAVVSQRSPGASVPMLSDLGDIGDGRCLAGVLSFYYPDVLSFSGKFMSSWDNILRLHFKPFLI